METKDYKIFKFHPANRPVTQKAVDNLILSIKKNGFIAGKEILVDENYQILDGQHRFEALKSLNMPVPFTITKGGNSFDKILALNTGQKNWTTMDYISSHARQGLDCYRQLLKFKEETKYPDMVVNIIVAPNFVSKDFREGKPFVVNPDRRNISVFLDGLNVQHKNDKQLVRAVVTLFKKATPEQIKAIGDKLISIPRLHSMNEYLIAFENILNYKKRGEGRVKLL